MYISFQLNGLIRLHLSGNKLKKFNFKSGCLQNLIVLDLSRNEFSTFSFHLWEVLPGLATVDISSNPLNCNCDIMLAVKELTRSPTSSVNQVNLPKNQLHETNLSSPDISVGYRECLPYLTVVWALYDLFVQLQLQREVQPFCFLQHT